MNLNLIFTGFYCSVLNEPIRNVLNGPITGAFDLCMFITFAVESKEKLQLDAIIQVFAS